MAQEVELKLSLPEAEQQRFLRSPLLRGAHRSSERLVNIYYDTPDLALHCSGIALRLRQSRRRWLQTVKCAGGSSAGLSSRPEWESPFAEQFAFSGIDDLHTRKRLQHLKHRLVPIFETSFLRTTWKICEGDTELIVALDRGSVVANGSATTISEVEIELVTGQVDQIFSLASRLAEHFSLTPESWSKAERGYRLFLGTPQKPARATPVAIHGGMQPLAAFRQIAEACLNHLQLNHSGAMHSDDAEYIHQMRVALRRLRAAVRLFDPLLPASFGEQLLPHLHGLMQVLGKARDLDVLTGEIVNPVMLAMPLEPRIAAIAGLVAERRESARQAAIATLSAPEYGRMLLLAMTLINKLPIATDTATISLPDFASARLRQQRRKTVRLAQAARQSNPESLHALRIAAKRLRYALEFFTPLLPMRRTVAVIKQMARLQDTLGQLNDLANAGALLMDCAGDKADLREAVSLIGGWHGQRHASLLASVPKLLAKLNKSQRLKAK